MYVFCGQIFNQHDALHLLLVVASKGSGIDPVDQLIPYQLFKRDN